MDSDPVRRQGPERDNAEGEVVLGASPPARQLPEAAGGPVGTSDARTGKARTRSMVGVASDALAARLRNQDGLGCSVGARAGKGARPPYASGRSGRGWGQSFATDCCKDCAPGLATPVRSVGVEPQVR